MTRSLTVYSVNLDKVQAACGSNDLELADELCDRYARELSAVDDARPTLPPTSEALRRLIRGETIPEDGPESGAKYIFGFRYIVEHFGRFLDNSLFMPAIASYLEQVGGALSSLGAELSFDALVRGGVPVELPEHGERPAVGHWSADAVVAAHEALVDASISDVDAYARAAVDTIREWLRIAAGKGNIIIGFYE